VQGASGSAGATGANGVSVTSAVEPVGANCAKGGSKFTASNGVTYACNGAAGATGATGATGVIASTTIVTGTAASTGGNPAIGSTAGTSTATCAAGSKLLGGGANVTQGNNGNVKAAVAVSYPSATNTWTATAIVLATGPGDATITAYAICG
jgi:hypothetical protein